MNLHDQAQKPEAQSRHYLKRTLEARIGGYEYKNPDKPTFGSDSANKIGQLQME